MGQAATPSTKSKMDGRSLHRTAYWRVGVICPGQGEIPAVRQSHNHNRALRQKLRRRDDAFRRWRKVWIVVLRAPKTAAGFPKWLTFCQSDRVRHVSQTGDRGQFRQKSKPLFTISSGAETTILTQRR